ncbi:MAG: iron-containing alcohol dehydrogenase, partial [Elusimicrobiota bacterium]
VVEPKNIEARTGLMDAAIMGATAFQKGLGAVHSFAHALSTVADLHHGLANGIMIPYVLEFNRPAVDARMRDLAAAVGAKDFVVWLKSLREEIGIPHTLGPAGVKPEHLDRLVEVAQADFCHSENPRPVSEADFRGIYTSALGKN